MQHQYFVYILKCADDSFYVGVTNNLELRFKQHQQGLEKSAYTYSRRPLELVYCETFKYIDKAIVFEKKLKGWSRKKKQVLIDDNWPKIQELSKNARNRGME